MTNLPVKATQTIMHRNNRSSVTRQKGESQNGCFKKTKHAKFSEKRTFLTYVCVSGGKKCSFFGKFGMLCLLETPVLRFALLFYYRRVLAWPLKNVSQNQGASVFAVCENRYLMLPFTVSLQVKILICE